MSGPQYSTVWPKVEALRPALRAHIELHRQYFRGGLWYILEDRIGGKYYRFSPQVYGIIGLMDGRRSLDEIYQIAKARLRNDMPSQDELIQLLSQLHLAGVLTTDALPDLQDISSRAETMARKKLFQTIKNPLGVRIPLLNIDRFITATYPLVRLLFTWLGALLWLGLIVAGLVTAGLHWQPLVSDLTDRVLSAQGIALLLVAYPLVKAVHELGHAYAIKHWGGQVREVGVMMLVFMPVPYVDASASIGFAQKRARIVVAGAGIMVELALASLAMLAWAEMEPGMLRALMFNIMLIGGVSTLLFNGNPLLKFDGYYIFADLIEVPNLGMRSGQYLSYLVRRYLFGLGHLASPITAKGERKWLASYNILAFLYRLTIMVSIALFVAGKFFFVGIALALWSVFQMLGLPILKALSYLLASPELQRHRRRAGLASAGLVALIGGPILFWPAPYATIAQGVVQSASDMRVLTETSGWVERAAQGARVAQGAPLVRLANPQMELRERVVQAQYDEAVLRLNASVATTPLQTSIQSQRLALSQSELARIRSYRAAQQVVAQSGGVFVPRRLDDLTGQHVAKGELLGYLVEGGAWHVRVAVRQRDIDRIQSDTQAVSLRFASDLGRVYRGTLGAQVPRATTALPSPALGTAGGGPIAADPGGQGTTALESLFWVDIEVEGFEAPVFYGQRVYVRFAHGDLPLAQQLWRSGRQVFLDQFGL